MQNRTEGVLATATLLLGLIGAASVLGRGAWLDEFWTLASGPPGQSFADFWGVMAREVNPPLHYGLIQVAQWAGLTDIAALRALNFLGVPLTLWALWLAHRDGSVTFGGVCAVVALYTSSPFFLGYGAELRCYFLLLSASVAVALLAKTLVRRHQRGEPWRAGDLAAWSFTLLVFTNLHYFALLLGGLLTVGLIAMRRGKGVIALALVSLSAAAPAMLMLAVQASSLNDGLMGWIATGRIDAAFVMIDQIFRAGGYNLVAFGAAVLALLALAPRRDNWAAALDDLLLLSALAVFFAILLVLNAIKPVVIDRYLIAMSGCVIVPLASFSARSGVPRWTVPALCVFALGVQARAIYQREFAFEGWRESASAVARLRDTCPSARVFIDPTVDAEPETMFVAARRLGQTYYADQFALGVEEIRPGDTLPAPGECPNLLWVEHMLPNGEDPRAGSFIAQLDVGYIGQVEIHRAGTGLIMINSAAP